MRCFAYSIQGTFDVNTVINSLNIDNSVQQYDETYHIKFNQQKIPDLEGDLFFFKYGAFVSWGLTEEIENSIIKSLNPNNSSNTDEELYIYGYGDKAMIKDNYITLPNKNIYSKLAFSHGLAQTVKLGSFELAVEHKIIETKHIPISLAKHGKILLSRKEIRKIMGRLFMDRSQINLHLDFLNPPDFFWDREYLEPIHEFTTEYFTLEKRVSVLNQRLDVLQEIFDILTNELQHQHSSRLEITIIVLILIETLITIGKEVIHVI